MLEPGQTCFCRTRTNYNGKLLSHAYNNPCIITLDPMEKLPLNHFLPDTTTLSLAIGGCNLRCLYCQNWQQSQSRPEQLRNFYLTKEDALRGAQEKKCAAIAHTYTEPVVFYEYVRDSAVYAKERGMRTVVATALYINPPPLRELCRCVDAFAVALKGWDEKFYEKVLGSELKPVLTALETIRTEGTWLELVTLIVPTYNDDLKKVREMCRWVRRNLGADVPLHFARFVPQYKLKDLPRTPVQTLEQCREVGLEEGLRFVYLSNVAPHEGNYTFCPRCKTPLIKRLGFKVLENSIGKGTCARCKTKLPGVWA